MKKAVLLWQLYHLNIAESLYQIGNTTCRTAILFKIEGTKNLSDSLTNEVLTAFATLKEQAAVYSCEKAFIANAVLIYKMTVMVQPHLDPPSNTSAAVSDRTGGFVIHMYAGSSWLFVEDMAAEAAAQVANQYYKSHSKQWGSTRLQSLGLYWQRKFADCLGEQAQNMQGGGQSQISGRRGLQPGGSQVTMVECNLKVVYKCWSSPM
jgi:hypothetical protein